MQLKFLNQIKKVQTNRRVFHVQKYPHPDLVLAVALLSLMVLFYAPVSSGLAASSYSPYLRRYPYLTDVVNSYATINWATDQSNSTGAVRWGKVGSETCAAHYVSASRTIVVVNGVSEFQWKALLNLTPGTQYCYRVYLGSSPATEVDLLGSDPAPLFWTQVPAGSAQPYSFAVFGDWGYVDTTGNNPYQARLMSLIAGSGARFALTAGDNSYPSGSQTNYGDLVQTGSSISAIFGPLFWKVPGSSIPIFAASGNHGISNTDPNHPLILNFPQDRAVALSGGRYLKETYCCVDGTTSASMPSAWYAFDAGLARIYVLDSAWSDTNIGTASSYQVDHDYKWVPGAPEYQWLQADLASHPSSVKFAVWHYPLYADDPNQASDTFLQGTSSLEGLLKQYGVDIAFTGHSHTYERNFASSVGLPNYVTGGGGAIPGTLGTCTALDAYAIKFTTTGKACGSAPKPTSADQIYHFLLVSVNGTNVTVSPINSLGQTFDVMSYNFSAATESNPPTTPTNSLATAVSGTQINLIWSASSDDTAVRGYDVYRNGQLVTTTDAATLSYADVNLVPSMNYVYTLDAFDGSGNHSLLSVSTSATTSTTATYTFAPVADSYVASSNPTINYGLSGTLKADGSPDVHSYLRFNVSDISGAVVKATLRLYTTSSSSKGYQVTSVLGNIWDEAQVNYANAPALGPVINMSGKFSSGNWASVDVTSLVTGNGLYDLGVNTLSTSSISFNSGNAASNRPQLVIQTNVSAFPTSTPTATVTFTNTPLATNTPTLTPSSTPTPAATSTLTATNTATPVFTDMPTSTPTSTITLIATSTLTATNTATATPVFTDTLTPIPTSTNTPVATSIFTVTYTATPASTYTPMSIPTPTYSVTPTATSIFTSTPTFTSTSGITDTVMPTNTPIAIGTPTFTPISSTHIFSDGFESGNMSAWATSAGLTAQTVLVHNGAYAAQGNTTTGATYAKNTLSTSYSDSYARIYFNVVSYSSQVNLLRFRTSSGTSITYLILNTSGKLGLRNDIAATTLTSAASVGGGWHSLEYHVVINGTGSTTEVWLDGVKVSDLSVTTNFGSNLVGSFQIGEVQSGRTYNVIFDDVVFDTQRIGP